MERTHHTARRTWALLAGLLVAASPGMASATVDQVLADGGGCRNVFQGRTTDLVVIGDGVDLTNAKDNRLAVSGTGVTAEITKREGFFQGKKGRVFVRVRARSDAAAGNRTVTIPYVTGARDTFSLRVSDVGRVTSISVPGPAELGTAVTDVLVRVRGRNLPTSGLRATARSAGNPSRPIVLASGAERNSVGVRATLGRVTSTSADVQLSFSEPVQTAPVALTLGGANGCSQLLPTGDRSALVAGVVDRRNFVDDIAFPFGSRFSVGSVATIDVKLVNPVPGQSSSSSSSGRIRKSALQRRVRLASTGSSSETIFWRLVPGDVFQAAANGTSYRPGALNQVRVGPGEDQARLVVQVNRCPGGGGERDQEVTIQTWTHNTNVNRAPERVDRQFTIRCPSR